MVFFFPVHRTAHAYSAHLFRACKCIKHSSEKIFQFSFVSWSTFMNGFNYHYFLWITYTFCLLSQSWVVNNGQQTNNWQQRCGNWKTIDIDFMCDICIRIDFLSSYWMFFKQMLLKLFVILLPTSMCLLSSWWSGQCLPAKWKPIENFIFKGQRHNTGWHWRNNTRSLFEW